MDYRLPSNKSLIRNLTRHSKNTLEDIDKTQNALKIISKIKKDDKLNTKLCKIQKPSFYRWLERKLYQEDRTKTIDFVEFLYNRAFELINMSIHSVDKYTKTKCRDIIQDIILSFEGLQNLQSTYDEDETFAASFKTKYRDIEVRLAELRDKYPELFDDLEAEAKESSGQLNIPRNNRSQEIKRVLDEKTPPANKEAPIQKESKDDANNGVLETDMGLDLNDDNHEDSKNDDKK